MILKLCARKLSMLHGLHYASLLSYSSDGKMIASSMDLQNIANRLDVIEHELFVPRVHAAD